MKFKRFLSAVIAAAQLGIIAPMTSFAENESPVAETGAEAFASLSFTDSGINDTSEYAKKWGVQPLSYGNTPVSYNEDLNAYEATFNNSSNFYKLILNKELRNKMTNGYSLEVYFNPAQTDKTMNVIGAAQSQGFDYEVLAGGHFDTCLNHGSGWIKINNHTPGYDCIINKNTYYLMTVTYDGSNIKVYQNGDLKQTVASSGKLIFPTENQADSKGDPYYGVVIGGDYNPTRYSGGTQPGYAIEQTTAQGAFSGKIVFANFYGGAMTADEVKASYDGLTARKSMTAIDELNTLLTSSLADKKAEFDDDKELAELIEEGWALIGKINVTEDEIAAYMEKANAYEPKHPVYEDGVKLRVGVLSDFQYGRNSSDSSDFKSALKQIIARAGGQENLDAIMLVGDISHHSLNAEYDKFLADIEEVLPRETRHPKILPIRGNHDAQEGVGSDTGIKDRRDNYLNKMREYDPSVLTTNGIAEVNGYQFVYVSQDNQKSNDDPTSTRSYLHSPTTVTSFKNNMAAAAAKSEGKPLFVIMHPNVTDTVYGSYVISSTRAGKPIQSDFWGTSELKEGIAPYSNAITFSGHSHWTIAHPRSVQRSAEGYYSLNTASTNNMEIETCLDEHYQPKRYGTSNENENAGYYFEVKTDESVEIHKMDFGRGSETALREFGEPIVIDVNSADNRGVDYTDNRDHGKPSFASDAKVTVSDVSETDCKVTFPQASDNETEVTSYKTEYINQNTQAVDKIVTTSSYFWLKGTDKEVTNHYFYLSDFKHNDSAYYVLSDNTPYKVKTTAVDAYGNESEPIYSDVFTTKEKVVLSVDDSAIVSAFFTNNALLDNSNYAVENNKTTGVKGGSPISYNEELKRYEASSSRDYSCYNVLLPKDRYSLLQSQDGYTIEAYFKPEELKAGSVIIGAAQTGGFDIEYTSGGTLEVYVRNSSGWIKGDDGKYPGSSVTLKTGQYYHIAAAVTPSQVKVYLNGELVDTVNKGSVFTPPSGNDLKNHYSVHLGGDYNNGNVNSQNQMIGKIVFGKVYQRALTDTEIQTQYNQINDRKSLTAANDLRDALEKTIPSKFAGSKDPKRAEFEAEGGMLMGKTALTAEEIAAFIAKVNAYKPIMPADDGNNLRFAVLGDYQYGRGLPSGFTLPSGFSSYSEYVSSKVKNAIQQAIEKSRDKDGLVRLDAILVPGDITHNGNDSEYQQFVKDLDSIPEIADGSIQMIFIRGNHDCNKAANLGNFEKYLAKYGVQATNQVYDVNGYKFIALSQDTGGYSDYHNPSGVTYLHEEETIKWFNNTLKTVVAEEKESGKPVFIATHPGPDNTMFGSYIINNPVTGKAANVWSTKDFYGEERKNATPEEAGFKGMKDYQNIISFSGHSHWAIQNPRSIWQGEFTALNTGSVNNMELENSGTSDGYQPKRYGTNSELESTGYYVTVDKDNVVNIEILDLYRQQTCGEPYVIDVNNKESWQYTDEKRDTTVPYFEENAKITYTELTENAVTINYPQAKDDKTAINNYVVKVTEKATGNVITEATPSSYYWLKGTKDEVTNNLWSVSGLTPDTEYTVEITPYNSYYKTGAPITGEFKTAKAYTPDEDTSSVYDLNLDTMKTTLNDNGEKVFALAEHGVEKDSSNNVIWTPLVISNDFTGNQKALRFSTRGISATPKKGQPGRLFKLNFAKDKVLNPAEFKDGIYTVDVDLGFVHDGNGLINIKLYGTNSENAENVISTINFNGRGVSSNKEKAYAVDGSNNRVGNMVDVSMGNANKNVTEYNMVRMVVDLNNNTYSAYIAKESANPQYSRLVENQPFINNADVISAVEFNITDDSLYTYGIALKQIKVEKVNAPEFSAVINADKTALLSGEETTVTVDFNNPDDARNMEVYVAAYAENGVLLRAVKEEKAIASGADSISKSFAAPEGTARVKVYVWEKDMNPITTLTAE